MYSEYLSRKADALMALSYGIGYLDDALIGIRPCDLIIMAAKTGSGKTEVGAQIAIHNAHQGKRVCLMALEAERYEIERRLKYQVFAKRFFEQKENYPTTKLTFGSWVFDKHPELEKLELEVSEEMPKYLENLQIYDPNISNFSKSNFATLYEELAPTCNLIVLDHIHYISGEEKENEYEHIKRTMWSLRDLINKHRVPIIAMSHLRKEDKVGSSLVPTLEDLHGSSEITKQANAVVSFAPAFSIPSKSDADKTIRPPPGSTFCKVLKARVSADRAINYMALLRFDMEQRRYANEYAPYFSNRFSNQINPMKYEDFEYWQSLAREPRV